MTELEFIDLRNMIDEAHKVRIIGLQNVFTAEAVIAKARKEMRRRYEEGKMGNIEKSAYKAWEDEQTDEAVKAETKE